MNYTHSRELLRVNGVDTEKSLDTFGEETYIEILTIFVNEIDDRVNKMNEALNTNNMKDYATHVHAIKGESGYLGFTKLAEETLNHQLKAESSDVDFIRSDYQNLMNEIRRVTRVGKIYLGLESFH